MKRLFSPWRSKYIESFSQPAGDKSACVLCKAFQDRNDDEHLVVVRGTASYVLMNLYPYNSGHVMVVPYRHVPDLADLSDEEIVEIMAFVRKMMKALRDVAHPEGFNVGSNIGRTAGAGIDQHVHFHIVPRWEGDTNFMPILADTKMISEDMREMLVKLRKALQ
ncbi:MAG: HIT domain-containing protein [Bacteroidota bacterium]|jgi:ATP adenylyltransferase